MTPANPDNNKPFIYRIADALGITHLVVAVQHSHLMSEIDGLVSALAGKSDTSHSHNTIQYNPSAPTDGFAGFPITGNGDFVFGVQDNKKIIFQFGGMPKASVTKTNADNLARALQDPDTTPTANSDKLVTSGGVKAALDGKQDNLTFDSTPTEGSTNPVTSGGVKAALDGKQDALTFDSNPTAGSTNPVTSGGVAAALAQKANKSLIDNTVSGIGRAFIQLGTDDETEIHVEIQVAKNGVTDNADITVDNMPNLQRALQTPDSTPTSNSNNLVTSGGVKAAIDAATNVIETNDVAYDASKLEKGIVYTFLFHNETGEMAYLEELINSNALPSPESFKFFNADSIHTEIGNGDTAALRAIRTSRGIFVHYDGTFDY